MGRNVIRTSNNPVADFAEFIVAEKMSLCLAANSTAGYDAVDKDGKKYQIKSRRITSHNKSRQLGVIRNLEQGKFDFLVGILFNEDFKVLEVYQIPIDTIGECAKFSEHQNGHILKLKGDVLMNIKTKNITHLFK
jgi:hypothetical protein